MVNSKWNYSPQNTDNSPQHETQGISPSVESDFNLPVIKELLKARGVNTAQEAQEFFYPSLADLHDPFLMPGMDKAVARLNKALGRKEKIMVFGDYDVDGTTAVALVYKYLQGFYSNVEYYIPTREDDGYGITCKAVDEFKEAGVSLVIILDCGIKAIDEVAYAKTLGIDFIICDHHVPDDALPDAAAILNPKLEGSTYPFHELSGCGVGFKFMQGFAISNGIHEEDLMGMLDLVAVSIAADIVPIVDENRIMAYHGLRRLNTNPNMGLRAIMRICDLNGKQVTISDVIFKISPRINASGRMQRGIEAVDLLVARDFHTALACAKAIDGYNSDRKELDKRITDEANAIIDRIAERLSSRRSMVIYNKDWHKGIIGIVASRLTEMYYKPVVVLTLHNGLATGSSRSSQGFDVYKAVDACRDLLENFGGHSYAVGLSLCEENIPAFTKRFEEYVARNILPEQLQPTVEVDAEIVFGDLTNRFLKALKQFNPFGPGNEKPVFRTRMVSDFGTSKLVGKNNEHIKLELTDETSGKVMDAIAFNQVDKWPIVKSGKPFTICYTIEENRHRSAKPGAFQLLVSEISPE